MMKHTFCSQAKCLTGLLLVLLPSGLWAVPRDAASARRVADAFATRRRMGSLSPANLPGKAGGRRQAPSANQPAPYYVFTSTTTDGGKGFVIVAGDDRMPGVLAYSDCGAFDADNLPPSVAYWLECYEEDFRMAANGNHASRPQQPLPVRPEGVAPLLGANVWGQEDPFNRLCPQWKGERCVVGCVATAMAQVMHYHRHPERGQGMVSYTSDTHSLRVTHDFAQDAFRWDEMLDDYRHSFSKSEAEAVAVLMASCGAAVRMDYGIGSQGGSGAYQSDLTEAFCHNFGYDQDAGFMLRAYCPADEWHRLLLNELNAGRPVNYGGQSARDGGHSFVIDGYRTEAGEAYPYYHVNWGWEGRCNGYYQITSLAPTEDGVQAYGSFNGQQQITLGIQPEDHTNDGTLYMCADRLHASPSQVMPGGHLQVITASLTNLSYRSFEGMAEVELVCRDDGAVTVLGEQRVRSLSYMQEKANLSIEADLPADLKGGTYDVYLRARRSGQAEGKRVFTASAAELQVGEDVKPVPTPHMEATLASTTLETLKDDDPSVVGIRLYALQNTGTSFFIGDLRMVLADAAGNSLKVFGETVYPGEIGVAEIVEQPLNLRGALDGEWPDGDYRLYVGARPIDGQDYTYIAAYDILQPFMPQTELYLNARIEAGVLRIGSDSFPIRPDAVRQPWHAIESADVQVFSFGGVAASRSGLRIVRMPDGHVRKVLVR